MQGLVEDGNVGFTLNKIGSELEGAVDQRNIVIDF